MKGNLSIYYDEEGDFLELNIGRHSEGYFKNLGDGVFQRVDKKTKEITGIAIAGFRKRTQSQRPAKISLPVKMQLTA